LKISSASAATAGGVKRHEGEFITESADKIGAVIEILFIIKKG